MLSQQESVVLYDFHHNLDSKAYATKQFISVKM